MTTLQRTHYDVLGISRDADASAVRAAWKLHVQAWHPDRFTGPMRDEAERQAQQINEAYTVLRDGSRRAAYDCRLAADAADEVRATRTSHKVRPAAPRAAAAPVGSPMALPEPATLGEQAAAMTRDAFRIVARHPRITAAAVTVWVVVFGGSLLMHALSGPTLPATASASDRPAIAAAAVADSAQTEDLENLAERARTEAAQADAEMEQLMREDAAIAAAEARAVARERALAARAARTSKRSGAAPKAAKAAGRVVRVMPNVR